MRDVEKIDSLNPSFFENPFSRNPDKTVLLFCIWFIVLFVVFNFSLLRFRLYKVQHGIHFAFSREDLAMVGYPLPGFDLLFHHCPLKTEIPE